MIKSGFHDLRHCWAIFCRTSALRSEPYKWVFHEAHWDKKFAYRKARLMAENDAESDYLVRKISFEFDETPVSPSFWAAGPRIERTNRRWVSTMKRDIIKRYGKEKGMAMIAEIEAPR